MGEIDVSVIIVSYNTKPILERCLTALTAESESLTLQVIIVDNGSTDGSADYLRSAFPQHLLLASSVNLGFGPANNWALQHAVGRYLLALNTDAFLTDAALERAVKRLDQRTDVGLVGARLVGEHGEWQPSARSFPTVWTEFLTLSGLSARFPHSPLWGLPDNTFRPADQAFACDWVVGAFLLVRRNVVDTIGFFDERFFLYFEEVDFCLRAAKAGFRTEYWPDIVVIHLGGTSTQTLNEGAISSKGRQMELWRLQSQDLYHRKHGGWWGAWGVHTLELCWHRLRQRRNHHRNPQKAAQSATLVQLIRQAWTKTRRGRVSPPAPWEGGA